MGNTILEDAREVGSRVQQKAYELYEQHGCQEGHAQDDWFEAEKIVENELLEKFSKKKQ